MDDLYLVIFRDEEEPSTSIRTKQETEKLLEQLTERNIEWIHKSSDVDSSWWYDGMGDWPEKTGIIIRMHLMRPKSVKVVTKYSLEPTLAYED